MNKRLYRGQNSVRINGFFSISTRTPFTCLKPPLLITLLDESIIYTIRVAFHFPTQSRATVPSDVTVYLLATAIVRYSSITTFQTVAMGHHDRVAEDHQCKQKEIERETSRNRHAPTYRSPFPCDLWCSYRSCGLCINVFEFTCVTYQPGRLMLTNLSPAP